VKNNQSLQECGPRATTCFFLGSYPKGKSSLKLMMYMTCVFHFKRFNKQTSIVAAYACRLATQSNYLPLESAYSTFIITYSATVHDREKVLSTSHLLDIYTAHLPRNLSSIILYEFLSFPPQDARPLHRNIYGYISDFYQSLSFSLCNILSFQITSSFLDANTSVDIFFSCTWN
jgi:hypothetical protein